MRYEAQTTNLILAAARQARGFGHSYVGSAHLLLALTEESGKLGMLLQAAGVERDLMRDLMAVLHGVGTPDLPLPQGLTTSAGRILQGAAREARALGSRCVWPEHVLLSLLRLPDTAAQELLMLCQVDRDELFTRTLEYLSVRTIEGNKRK